MALIGIGDIHGCAQTLDVLLDRLDPSQDDHLVFVGDYVDRGPDSKGVIDRLLALRESVQCTFLRGNHEAFFLDYIDHGHAPGWAKNGGDTTLASYRVDGRVEIPESHAQFVRSTKLVFDTPDFLFVHAGLRPEYTVARNLELGDESVFLWERGHMGASRLNWEKTVVCGHTPVQTPLNQPRLINIDTGCVFAGRFGLGNLTAVVLPEREFVCVPFSD